MLGALLELGGELTTPELGWLLVLGASEGCPLTLGGFDTEPRLGAPLVDGTSLGLCEVEGTVDGCDDAEGCAVAPTTEGRLDGELDAVAEGC